MTDKTRTGKLGVWCGILALALALTVSPARSEKDVHGEWAGPFDWPEVAAHLLHLPPVDGAETGSILVMQDVYSGSDTDAWVWSFEGDCFDQANGCFDDVDILGEGNLFCSGHTALTDRRVIVAGGHTANHMGLRDTFLFDPASAEPWTKVGNMHLTRWYPTLTTLPDGKILSMAGTNHMCDDGDRKGQDCFDNDNHTDCPGGECVHTHIKIPEVFDPSSGGWTKIDNQTFNGAAGERSVPFYPFIFVLPDGSLVFAGSESNGGTDIPGSETWRLELDVGAQSMTWTSLDDSGFRGASAVMWEPGKILKSGGPYRPSTDTTKIIDLNVDNAQWESVGDLHFNRVYHNTTLLPDGTILVTGGSAWGNQESFNVCDGGDRDEGECTADADCPDGACRNRCVGGNDNGGPCDDNDDCDGGSCKGGQAWVAAAELLDPRANNPTWSQKASAQTPRMYHSTAMLLPDGRVVSAGSGQSGGTTGPGVKDYRNAEIYSPPYLFDGDAHAPRPVIASAPTEVHFGDVFPVTSSQAQNIRDPLGVNLIRIGSVTHSFDANQRFVPAVMVDQSSGSLEALAPGGPTVAPPGYYMLFLVDNAGTPSVASYVRLGGPTAIWVDFNHPGNEEGTFELPFDTVQEGIQKVSPGGVLRIKAGSNGAAVPAISKPMTIRSFGGSAILGG